MEVQEVKRQTEQTAFAPRTSDRGFGDEDREGRSQLGHCPCRLAMAFASPHPCPQCWEEHSEQRLVGPVQGGWG